MVFLLALGLAAFAGCGYLRAQTTLPHGTRIDRLLVDKSEGRMWAYDGDQEVAVYRVAVGRGGLGPKRWEGDGRTPEGTYRIDERHRSENFHRFLHVSYPAAADRRRYRALRAQDEVPREGGRPVGIGGAIGIHGTGDGFFRRTFGRSLNRTLGCIMVSNAEAIQLYTAVVPGASIEIRE
ncbi:MAG: L,D-transpeptidase family protein [Polyangiales bacterium]